MIDPRGRCGWIHSQSLTRSDGPLRTSREAAIADECERSHDRAAEAQPWIVETSSGDLLHDDPTTGQWWTATAAQQHVDQGSAAWAYPRRAIGLED